MCDATVVPKVWGGGPRVVQRGKFAAFDEVQWRFEAIV